MAERKKATAKTDTPSLLSHSNFRTDHLRRTSQSPDTTILDTASEGMELPVQKY